MPTDTLAPVEAVESDPAERSTGLRSELQQRVVVADGAMGTMLQQADLTLADFDGLGGCNEILNVTRPEVVRGIHDAYFAAGCDCVTTNTFGCQSRQPRRVRKSARADGPTYDELVETEGRPRLRAWLDRIGAEGILEPAVVYGYWPRYSEGDDLVVLDTERPSDALIVHHLEAKYFNAR